METGREEKIEAILDFVHQYPESLASRTILRRLAGGGYLLQDDGGQLLAEKLAATDEETLTGFYYLVK